MSQKHLVHIIQYILYFVFMLAVVILMSIGYNEYALCVSLLGNVIGVFVISRVVENDLKERQISRSSN